MKMPFYIEVSNKRLLIIGGGAEAAKRARKYAQAGAKVTVLALSFTEGLKGAASKGTIETVRADVSDTQLVERFISDSDLVMVALDTSEHNESLSIIAKRVHRLLNLTNDASSTEVAVPVEREVHEIRLAATSEGKSVHVTREVLDRAVRFLETQSDLWVLLDVMQEVKQTLRRRGVPLEERMRIYPAVYADRRVREEAGKQNLPGARDAANAAVNRLLDEMSRRQKENVD